jgi:hypothetical protein
VQWNHGTYIRLQAHMYNVESSRSKPPQLHCYADRSDDRQFHYRQANVITWAEQGRSERFIPADLCTGKCGSSNPTLTYRPAARNSVHVITLNTVARRPHHGGGRERQPTGNAAAEAMGNWAGGANASFVVRCWVCSVLCESVVGRPLGVKLT